MYTSIYNLVIDSMVEWLRKELIEGVEPETDLPRLIRAGNLQADPTKNEYVILIKPSVSGNEMNPISDVDYGGVRRTIGNQEIFWRTTYCAEVSYFVRHFDNDRQAARTSALELLQRLQVAVFSIPCSDLMVQNDREIHIVHAIFPCEMGMEETGGNKNFIWKGFVKFEAVTSLEIL